MKLEAEAVLSWHSIKCPKCGDLMISERTKAGEIYACIKRGCPDQFVTYKVATPVIPLTLIPTNDRPS